MPHQYFVATALSAGEALESSPVRLARQLVRRMAGQEILTKDKVRLRINLTAGYRVSDVLLAFSRQAKPVDYLYEELQFGLRLKELETLEKVTEIPVFGGLDGVLKDLVKI